VSSSWSFIRQLINFVYTRKKILFACVQVDGVLVPDNVM